MPFVKIQNKLFLVLFSFGLLLVTALVLLIQWSMGKGMIEYINSKETEALKPLVVKLSSEYHQQHGWSSLQGDHDKLLQLIFFTLKDTALPLPVGHEELRQVPREKSINNATNSFRHPPREEIRGPIPPEFRSSPSELVLPPPSHFKLEGQPSYALLDNNGQLVVGFYDKNATHRKTAIAVDGVNVGWLLTAKREHLTDGYELAFIEQQTSYLWLIALAMMVLVGLVTLPLARHLVEPIKLIILGMGKLTQGDYQQHIRLKRKDELGELGRDFNELALTLYENDSMRKRWLANTSHELRTPVAILRGELEAMIDGVRPLNTVNIDSINDEVKHLQHLIDDLQQLTSADIGGMHYRKKNENLMSWLHCEMKKHTGYLQSAGITLEIHAPDQAIHIFADSTRLCQLFDNIINNCIKYSQADIARISVEIDTTLMAPVAMITIEDNGIGVPDQHLSYLFEHLYRVENSRNRKTGGSGLGLSICAHIVAAHQGKISAEASSLGGLAILIELPLSQ